MYILKKCTLTVMRILDYYKYSRNGTFLSVHFSKCTLTVMPILLYKSIIESAALKNNKNGLRAESFVSQYKKKVNNS